MPKIRTEEFYIDLSLSLSSSTIESAFISLLTFKKQQIPFLSISCKFLINPPNRKIHTCINILDCACAQRTSQVASICQRMNLYLYMYACVTQTLEEEKSSVHSGQLLSAESDQKKRKKLLFVRSVGKRREL